MPLPIAHSAAGLAGYFAFKKRSSDSPPIQELFLLGLCLFLANLPDLDFIPGFLCGEIGRFHHGPSHSLVVGLVGALIFYQFACYWLTGISKKRIFGCCLVSLLILLECLCSGLLTLNIICPLFLFSVMSREIKTPLALFSRP